ncbi:hypothetical protein U1Q18_013536 [Sarracenia purpurea var. burkii]
MLFYAWVEAWVVAVKWANGDEVRGVSVFVLLAEFVGHPVNGRAIGSHFLPNYLNIVPEFRRRMGFLLILLLLRHLDGEGVFVLRAEFVGKGVEIHIVPTYNIVPELRRRRDCLRHIVEQVASNYLILGSVVAENGSGFLGSVSQRKDH